MDIGKLLGSNTILELDSVTDDQDKAFLMGIVIIRIVEHLRVKFEASAAVQLKHILVIEEAHRLLKASAEGAARTSVEQFA